MTWHSFGRALLPAVAAVLAVASAESAGASGETIAQIKSRGALRCSVSEGIAGFSAKDASGRWVGLDADFCRAVAAAVLGEPDKVSFVPLRASARFPALQSRSIDLLARSTTWTLTREVGLKVQFAGVLFYDAQAFMVPAASPVKAVSQLKGATVCVVKGTTHEGHLVDYFASHGMTITPLVIDSTAEVAEAFFAGRCRAYTSDASQLAGIRRRAPAGRGFRILTERISKEPLGPVVRDNDDDWLTVVRWVLIALVAAEEQGITQQSARGVRGSPRETTVRRALGGEPEVGKALGVDPDWALRAVQSVGNYGEMFERNLGAKSALKLERGANRLWTQGGLMYAPPAR